jgi:hypothetical protein
MKRETLRMVEIDEKSNSRQVLRLANDLDGWSPS